MAQACGWPLVVLFIIVYFRLPLKRFLADLGEFSFKAGASGLEATAKKHQIEAAALLGAASATKKDIGGGQQVPDEDNARKIAEVVSQSVQPRVVRRLAEATALWVDDNPENNSYERKALAALGLDFGHSGCIADSLV